ncbi:hypothetical protein [Halomontanus rarus]|uniref:hypothetical protein n=1 Tax=Halomontanus rarus TaxID=3034020 RepID=UPI00307B8E1C
MSRRLESVLGFAVAYLTTGLIQWTLFGGASLRALKHALATPIVVALWPIMLFDPVAWAFTAVALVVALGLLAALEHSRLPITAPRRFPTIHPRHSLTVVGTLLVAEVVARFAAAAALVVHFHLWTPYRGTPGGSLSATVGLYRDALSFMVAYLDAPAIFYAGHLLPEIGALPTGGLDTNYALRQIGEIQFFDGIGFAIVVGYLVAVAVSYVGVRVVSRRITRHSSVVAS